MAIKLDWLTRVRQHLLAADIQGITFQELMHRVRTPVHPVADLRLALKIWKARRWVDNYQVSSGGRGHPKQIWRATQKMIDEWPLMVQAYHAAPTEAIKYELLVNKRLPFEEAAQQAAEQTASSHA